MQILVLNPFFIGTDKKLLIKLLLILQLHDIIKVINMISNTIIVDGGV
jgi:hypothetical protein